MKLLIVKTHSAVPFTFTMTLSEDNQFIIMLALDHIVSTLTGA